MATLLEVVKRSKHEEEETLRVLVTGGSGYIAQFILRGWREAFPNAQFFTTFNQGQWDNNNSPIHGLFLDFTDEESIRSVISIAQPTVVIHCAAMTALAQCEKNPEAAHTTNVSGPSLMLRLLDPGTHVIFLSTDQVFSSRPPSTKELAQGLVEDSPTDSINVYGRSKREFELILLGEEHANLMVTILRCSNVFGPSTMPFQALKPGVQKFLQFVQQALLKDEGSVTLWQDEFRSYVFVLDIFQATLAAFKTQTRGIFNCGGPTSLSRVEFAEIVLNSLGIPPTTQTGNPRIVPGNNTTLYSPSDLTMDSSKLETVLMGKKMTPFATETLREWM